MKKTWRRCGLGLALVAGALLCWGGAAQAKIEGLTGTSFTLVAKQDKISMADGDQVLMWGFANGPGGRMQYPGPTLIVQQGQTITVSLVNQIPPGMGQNVSLLFPGHPTTAAGGVQGTLTQEAPPDGTTVVTYTFQANWPGTYTYHSGTRMDLQIEMGLLGALIVRPNKANATGCWAPEPGHAPGPASCLDTKYAYNTDDSGYQREFLFVITDLDPTIHRLVELGRLSEVDTTQFFATCWFINGRNFPDIMGPANAPWLPTQPYNCSPIMHPGETILARVIGGGRDPHPLHFHGNHVRVIAKDGRLLSSTNPSVAADLSYEDYTVVSNPGETYDALFTWTGKDMAWDAYGHGVGDAMEPYEYVADHGQIFPVQLPARDDLVFGAFYSGSPFLGGQGSLPPGTPGLNSGGGFFFMWHSHTEKELANNDIFPGGLITLVNVTPWSVDLPAE